MGGGGGECDGWVEVEVECDGWRYSAGFRERLGDLLQDLQQGGEPLPP